MTESKKTPKVKNLGRVILGYIQPSLASVFEALLKLTRVHLTFKPSTLAYWPRFANNLGLLATLREQPWPIGHASRTTFKPSSLLPTPYSLLPITETKSNSKHSTHWMSTNTYP
ncbi:MAG: hypothetical protein F6K55_05755 [Moorea sp. SIO4A3]|nr:hypothetical protein [Moorena sp. SIO4A3]